MIEHAIADSMSSQRDRGASAEAIQRHYDVGNDFYALWLDSTMSYSCGLWRDDADTLYQAQLNKLDWIGDILRSASAKSVLEIGCGWGGLSRRLVAEHGVTELVGLTLSPSQRGYAITAAARENLQGIDIRLESWGAHAAGHRYDAAVSIEAFEAFAKPEMSSGERIAQYRRFFETVWQAVRPGGKLVLQTISHGSVPDQPEGKLFFQEVFPESDCPRLTEILFATHGLFELEALRNDREDYVRTLNLWLRNLKRNEAAASAVTSAETVKFYKKYLALSSVGFKIHSRTLDRMVFGRL